MEGQRIDLTKQGMDRVTETGPADSAVAATASMDKLAWQGRILAERPRRLELLRLKPSWPLRPVRIRVHRNQPFEFAASAMRPFLEFAGLEPGFDYGPYDDALGRVGEPPTQPVDIELVWLDFARYLGHQEPEAIAEWLESRIRALRSASLAPILIADAAVRDESGRRLNVRLRERLEAVPGAYVVDQAGVANRLGEAYSDSRSEHFAGSSLSDAAAIETARLFGLSWIPAALGSHLKGIVLDLDGTIYDGVLGEDGPRDLGLSDDRAALQRRLVELGASGILLAVVSRNEPEDVRRLFELRPDFPLRPELLSAVVAGWRPKAEGIAAVADKLRIGHDAILFVDDNPGELAAVASALPEVALLHAQDAGQAFRGLSWYPGIVALRSHREDALRARDLASTDARRAMEATAPSRAAYLRSLEIRLLFARSPMGQLSRIHELSTKTNQFNTAFLRLSEAEAAARLDDPSCVIVTVSLRDRLSDSGVIGLVVVHVAAGALPVVEEVAISCRALGRGVEDVIVAEALRGALGEAHPDRVCFAFRNGPRNGPAREWLCRLAGRSIEQPEVEVPWTALQETRTACAAVVEITWREV
jgi:FkbH-like protein